MSIRKGTEIYKKEGKTYYKDAYGREHELKAPAEPSPPPPPRKRAPESEIMVKLNPELLKVMPEVVVERGPRGEIRRIKTAAAVREERELRERLKRYDEEIMTEEYKAKEREEELEAEAREYERKKEALRREYKMLEEIREEERMKGYKQKVLEGTVNPSRDHPEGKNLIIQKKMEETLEKLESIDVKTAPKLAYEYAALYKKLQDIQRQEPAEERLGGNSVVANLLGLERGGKE